MLNLFCRKFLKLVQEILIDIFTIWLGNFVNKLIAHKKTVENLFYRTFLKTICNKSGFYYIKSNLKNVFDLMLPIL